MFLILKGEQMKDKIKLVIPKKSEYVSVVRLTTSSISNLNGFNIEDIEDLKVILSEICVFFINSIDYDDKCIEIEYCIFEDKLETTVIDTNVGKLSQDNKDNSKLSMLIIESLADKFEIDYLNKKIMFTKFINKKLRSK